MDVVKMLYVLYGLCLQTSVIKQMTDVQGANMHIVLLQIFYVSLYLQRCSTRVESYRRFFMTEHKGRVYYLTSVHHQCLLHRLHVIACRHSARWLVANSLLLNVFSARRYASAVQCYRHVSVRPSAYVCHEPVLYQNG